MTRRQGIVAALAADVEMGNRRLVGWCTRCGGDVLDDGVKNYHRCPRERPEAAAVVALKQACDRATHALDVRPWARSLTDADRAELRSAIEGMTTALKSLCRD
jgi:hypothetical protein